MRKLSRALLYSLSADEKNIHPDMRRHLHTYAYIKRVDALLGILFLTAKLHNDSDGRGWVGRV